MKFLIHFLVALSFLSLYEIFPQTLGNAVDFDGYGDYRYTLNSPYFPTVEGTVEAWVKVRNIAPPENLHKSVICLLPRMKSNGT